MRLDPVGYDHVVEGIEEYVLDWGVQMRQNVVQLILLGIGAPLFVVPVVFVDYWRRMDASEEDQYPRQEQGVAYDCQDQTLRKHISCPWAFAATEVEDVKGPRDKYRHHEQRVHDFVQQALMQVSPNENQVHDLIRYVDEEKDPSVDDCAFHRAATVEAPLDVVV